MGNDKDETIAELSQKVTQLEGQLKGITREVHSIGEHPTLFPRLGPEGNTLVKVPGSTEEIEAFLKKRGPAPQAAKNPEAAPLPSPQEMEVAARERDKRNPVAYAKSATNAEELTRFGLGIFYTQAPELVQRVPHKPWAPLQVEKVKIDDLLSEQARVLGDKEIRSTLHVFEEDGAKYVVPCEYASKLVDLGPDGELPEEYVRRWANFLNDMAARWIWKYGTLQKCSFVEINTIDNNRRGVIMSFIFINRDFYKPGVSAAENLAELNKTAGSDVFRREGDVGSSDWSPAAFPW